MSSADDRVPGLVRVPSRRRSRSRGLLLLLALIALAATYFARGLQ